MENPFVAPEIRDIIRDKKLSRRQAVMLLLCGALFSALLLCAYYVVQSFYMNNAPIVEVVEPVVEEVEPVNMVTIEERQALADVTASSTVTLEERNTATNDADQIEISLEERQGMIDRIENDN